MNQQTVTIQNKLGLHARASALLSDTANKFQSSITLQFKSRNIDAKSILAVMTMGATLGAQIELITEGPDEDRAAEIIVELFNKKFGEKE